MSGHAIIHVEIPAKDLEMASAFYREAFGWDINQPPGFEGYRTFAAPGGPGGGFPQVDEHNVRPGQVTIYISTDDIDSSLAKIESLGGKTVMPKTEIPGVGWFGTFTDPTGNTLALFTSR